MRQSVFDYIDNLDTLLAVIVGALLATGGAMVAELVQARLGRRRKEREAARFFGEILTSVDRILNIAFESLNIGEPWGNVTSRLFKTALNETAIYERNRERLFDIRNIELRRQIHTHFLNETVPLVALLDYWSEIDALEKELKTNLALSDAQRGVILDELETWKVSRENALSNIKRRHAETQVICTQLGPLAGLEF